MAHASNGPGEGRDTGAPVTPARTDDPESAIVPELLRSERGPVYRIARRLRIWPGPGGAVRIGIAIAAVAWIPLVLLSAIDGRLLGGATIPMAGSLSVHARFLVAIPLFFLAESLFGDRAGDALGRLLRTEVVAGEDRAHYVRAWKRALSHWDHGAMEAALVALTLTAIYVGFRTDLPAGVSAWRTQVDGSLTLAGWWYSLVALPLFQFLLWRWGWRLLAWGWLLWRISRLRLRLVPIPPRSSGRPRRTRRRPRRPVAAALRLLRDDRGHLCRADPLRRRSALRVRRAVRYGRHRPDGACGRTAVLLQQAAARREAARPAR